MLANSSDNISTDLKSVRATVKSADVAWGGRLLMLVLNYWPLAHIILMTTAWFLPWVNWPVRGGIFLTMLYLLPPLVTRLLLVTFPISPGHITIGSRAFFVWWSTFQLQVIFSRLPALEEWLRFVPGLYSMWLRLWGSKIGRLTYWTPGTAITDRSFLCVGNNVVFGAGVRLNAHVLNHDKDGVMELILAPLKIGDRVLVGGYSLLTAGTEISAGEVTRACQLSPPFSLWQGGRRIKRADELE